MANRANSDFGIDIPVGTMDWIWSIVLGIVVLCVVIILVIITIQQYSECKSTEKPLGPQIDNQNDDKIWAITMGKEFLEKGLKCPSTASYHNYKSYQNNNGNWIFEGEVDAQNGFGAMLRKSFKVEMKRNGTQWWLIDISV